MRTALLLALVAPLGGCFDDVNACEPQDVGDVPVPVRVVWNASGAPIDEAYVRALRAENTGLVACAVTASNGDTVLHLTDGEWRVIASKVTEGDSACAWEGETHVRVPPAGVTLVRIGMERKLCA